MSALLEAADVRRVLLLSPPIADTVEVEQQDMVTAVDPFGLLRLGTYFRQRGCEVTLVDCLRDPMLDGRVRRHERKRLRCGDDGEAPVEKPVYHYGLTAHQLARRLETVSPPDLIAISTVFTWHAETTREAIDVCRRVHPQAKIVLGGNLATLCPDVAGKLGAHQVVAGDVPGAEFLPTAIDLCDATTRVDYLRLIKGCPFECSYCVTRLLNQGRTLARPPEQVYAELKAKFSQHGKRIFVFYDDFVLFRHTRYLDPFLDLVAQERLGVVLEFALGFSAALVDERFASRLRQAGVQRVILALETTSEARGKAMRRPQRLDQFVRAVRILQDYGYRGRHLRAFYLIGLPGQTMEEILRTLLWLYRLGVTPSLTTYTLTPRSQDMGHFGAQVSFRGLDELAPCLWRFAHPAMRVRELDAVYRYFHERFYAPQRILDSPTDDAVIRTMQRIARGGPGA